MSKRRRERGRGEREIWRRSREGRGGGKENVREKWCGGLEKCIHNDVKADESENAVYMPKGFWILGIFRLVFVSFHFETPMQWENTCNLGMCMQNQVFMPLFLHMSVLM